MDTKEPDPILDMVMSVKKESDLPLFTLLALAYRYARQEHSDAYIQEQTTQFTNHGVIPEPLLDLSIDYSAKRVFFRKGENPQTGNTCVWIVKV